MWEFPKWDSSTPQRFVLTIKSVEAPRSSILFANMKKSLTIIYTSYNVCNIILKVINTITETM